MTRLTRGRGVGFRIAVAALITTAVGVGIVGLGIVVVGADTFARLMVEHGASAANAHAMFDESISVVLAVAVIAAILAAIVLAMVFGQRLASPLRDIGLAARRIAAGDYAARVPGGGPEEVADLAESFNQMAVSLEENERIRRELIANAAHELRTPLTNLNGYLEALRDGVMAPDEAIYASLREEVERLVRLAASLDTLAEGDAAAIHNAVDLAAPSLERTGIHLELDLPDRLEADADPDGLAQILGNLLQNASRYTPPGGRVDVRAERRPGDVLVSVANTGPTIPAADLPHLFERFYRVDKSRDRAHGGAGIGLAIVRQRVEAVGGRVGVESSAGLTRFWFSLPALGNRSASIGSSAPRT